MKKQKDKEPPCPLPGDLFTYRSNMMLEYSAMSDDSNDDYHVIKASIDCYFGNSDPADISLSMYRIGHKPTVIGVLSPAELLVIITGLKRIYKAARKAEYDNMEQEYLSTPAD